MPDTDPVQSPSPSAATLPLLALILDAVDASDDSRLVSLLRDNADAVMEAFEDWLVPPPQVQPGSAEYHRYMNALYVISKTMSDCLGRGGLFQLLVRPTQDNSFAQWERRLEAGQRLVQQLRCGEAASLLSDHLIDVRDLPGFGYRHMVATTHWYISQAHLHARRRNDAVAHGRRALDTTLRIEDHVKYLIRYLKHLSEIHRYFGEAAPAADYLESLARLYEQLALDAHAVSSRSQAAIVRAGEPLTRVVAVVADVDYEMADVPAGPSGQIELQLRRNRISLLPALNLTGEAWQKAAAGSHEEALCLLNAATAGDPWAPEPLMGRARVQMALGDYAEAAASYGQAEELAPGWPGSRSGQWLAEQLAAGNLDPAVLQWLHDSTDSETAPTDRLKRVRRALEQEPNLPLLHVLSCSLLREVNQLPEVEPCCRQGLASDCDVDTRTRLLVELAQVTESSAERRQLLEEAMRLNGNLVAAAVARLMMRDAIAGRAG